MRYFSKNDDFDGWTWDLSPKMTRLAHLLFPCLLLLPPILVLFLLVCPSVVQTPCETPLNTRCNDNTVEICDAQQRWQVVMSCDAVNDGGWVCSSVEVGDEVGHACVSGEGETP